MNQPSKMDVVRSMLLTSDTMMVHLDPRVFGVIVPMRFRKQSQLVLQLGTNMPVPIPDLTVDEEGIEATLSFGGIAYTCVIPWVAVYAAVREDNKGMIWENEMPDDIKAQLKPSKANLSLVKN